MSIPVCDGSTVQVECLTGERLGVNVTWKLPLKDVPPASLPDLHDIGMFGDTMWPQHYTTSWKLFLHLSYGDSGAYNAFPGGANERIMPWPLEDPIIKKYIKISLLLVAY